MWLILLGIICASVGFGVVLAKTFSSRNTPWPTLLLAVACWALSVSVVLLLPFDVAETLAARCITVKDFTNDCTLRTHIFPPGSPKLAQIFAALYWTAAAFLYIFVPFASAYTISGAFSPAKRIRDAVVSLAWWWTFYLVLLIAGCVYFTMRYGLAYITALRGTLMSIGHSVGLFVVILALGNGLVALPRYLWLRAETSKLLRRAEFRAAETMERLEDAKLALSEIMADVLAALSRLEKEPDLSAEMLYCMRILQDELPTPSDNTSQALDSDGDNVTIVRFPPPADRSETSYNTVPSESALAELRSNLKYAITEFRKVSYLWHEQSRLAFYLQDVVELSNSGMPGSPKANVFSSIIRHDIIVSFLFRCTAILTGVFSALFVLAECSLWTVRLLSVPVDASVFSRMLHSSWLQSFSFGYFGIVLISCLTASYSLACFLMSVFRLRFLRRFELISHHTEPYTLLLNSMLCLGYIFPLAYNVLTLLQETSWAARRLFGSDVVTTSLSQALVNMEMVSRIGIDFNTMFPLTLAIVVVLAIFDVGERMMSLCGIRRFGMEPLGSDSSYETTGRHLLAIERSRWSRKELRSASSNSSLGIVSSLRPFSLGS